MLIFSYLDEQHYDGEVKGNGYTNGHSNGHQNGNSNGHTNGTSSNWKSFGDHKIRYTFLKYSFKTNEDMLCQQSNGISHFCRK